MKKGPKAINNPLGKTVTTKDIREDGTFNDVAAIALVLADKERAETWIADQEWKTRWHEAELLYQSPEKVSAWTDGGVTRANVPNFLIAQHVNSVLPQFLKGLFFEEPPFLSRPRPGTSQDTIDAMAHLVAAMMERTNFRSECESFLYSQLIFGTGIAKYGWETKTSKRKRYERKGDPLTTTSALGDKITVPTTDSDEWESVIEEITENLPFFESKDVRKVLVDPACRYGDIRRAGYVIDVMTMTYRDIDKMRKDPRYTLPSAAELRKAIENTEKPEVDETESSELGQDGITLEGTPVYEQTTDDPEAQPFEVLERWDAERVVTVLDGKWVIRNEMHEGKTVPFLSANFYNVPFGFWGLGIGKLIGPIQRVLQGSTNAALDILALAVNQQYVVNRAANVPTQSIRQRLGGIIMVDGDPRAALVPQPIPSVPQEIWMMIQGMTAQAEAATGANELLVQGSMPTQGRTSMGRTATGASAMASASASRLDGPFNRFLEQVYIPYIYILTDMVKERLPVSDMRDILGDEYGQEHIIDVGSMLNTKYQFDVLAGARMGVKQTMAQSLPLMMQLFDNPALVTQLQQSGNTVDVKELMEMFFEMSGWKDNRDVIRPMTAQEKQAQSANNPQANKMQMASQLQQQKFQADENLLSQKNQARAAEQVLRAALEKTEEPGAVTGQPSQSGFGGNL